MNTAQGFRFVLRDEPIEQWLEHHTQRTPRRAPEQRGQLTTAPTAVLTHITSLDATLAEFVQGYNE